MVSPKETVVYYPQLLDYLAGKPGRDIELVQRKTYGEVNELIGWLFKSRIMRLINGGRSLQISLPRRELQPFTAIMVGII